MRISDWSSDVCSSDLVGLARQHKPRNERQSIAAVLPRFKKRRAHAFRNAIGRHVGTVDIDREPADHIQIQSIDGGNLTILHGDDHRALGARLADRATLDVAREDDMRRLAHDPVSMYMAERPLVVFHVFKIFMSSWH